MDIAIGTGPIDESSNITNLKDKFTKWVNRLKTGDYNKIVHAVLLSISEGEDEDKLHGQLMMEPQATQWITEGINLVLLRVSQLSDSAINSVFDTWKDQSQHYGQYLKEVLESVKDAQNKRVGEPLVSGTKF
jgi:hypothetical protein